ncbi:uncharacterized protein EV420DRAFT_1765334 [Desarmillaria tabescens]|uniref:DUF6699 domain-containing protein n=1 Tax=Armillaria tabescens TaxID=1929756 RepID=A0AA39K9F7_ARMTA|nr:uncharacterized protein EV420DRAFT_1765334 [Desarmillaria tabescens]KAK0455679.1 hypothetical protein EV420DRAFT_1765334 [Desarmillaria tabescens]
MAQHANFGGHSGMCRHRERRRTRIYEMPPHGAISDTSSQSSRSSSRSSHSSDSSSDWSDIGYGSASSSLAAPYCRDSHHHWHVHRRDSQGLSLPELLPYTPSSDTGTPVIPDSSASSIASPVIPHVGLQHPGSFLLQGGRHPIYHGHTIPASAYRTPEHNTPFRDEVVHAFHPNLQQYYHPNPTDTSGFIHTPSLQWDIIYPPSRTRYLPGYCIIQHPQYMEAACAPPTVRRIHFTSTHECLGFWMSPDRWGPIIIDDPNLPTVHRILEKIHDYLRQPLSQKDIATILSTPINRSRLGEARRSRLHYTAGMQPYGGYVRSDVLGGHRRFFGCRMSIRDGIWRASVDFIPGPVLRLVI